LLSTALLYRGGSPGGRERLIEILRDPENYWYEMVPESLFQDEELQPELLRPPYGAHTTACLRQLLSGEAPPAHPETVDLVRRIAKDLRADSEGLMALFLLACWNVEGAESRLLAEIETPDYEAMAEAVHDPDETVAKMLTRGRHPRTAGVIVGLLERISYLTKPLDETKDGRQLSMTNAFLSALLARKSLAGDERAVRFLKTVAKAKYPDAVSFKALFVLVSWEILGSRELLMETLRRPDNDWGEESLDEWVLSAEGPGGHQSLPGRSAAVTDPWFPVTRPRWCLTVHENDRRPEGG